jgi:hypothetical protein
MSITITDPLLLAQFTQAGGVVQSRDPSGRVIGTFTSDPGQSLPPGVTSPVSDEAFEEARKQPDGLPLAEVWKRIHERHGS